MIQLPQVHDPRGNLTYLEGGQQLPFEFRRVYYLYDVPGGSQRGGHAHRTNEQFLIAISGSFDVHLDDGISKKSFHLNRANSGLYLCPMIWREIDNFSSNAVCLVLASKVFSERDYFRDYDEFRRAIATQGTSDAS